MTRGLSSTRERQVEQARGTTVLAARVQESRSLGEVLEGVRRPPDHERQRDERQRALISESAHGAHPLIRIKCFQSASVVVVVQYLVGSRLGTRTV